MKFVTPLMLTPRPDGGTWSVDEPFECITSNGKQFTVPAKFVTDLASIPPLGPIGGLVMLAGYVLSFVGLILSNWLGTTPVSLKCSAGGALLVLVGFLVTIASAYLLPFGKYTRAAVLHDWLYRNQVNRRFADHCLYEAMVADKTALWERVAIYTNVRLFGWIAWRNEKRVVNRPSTTARSQCN